MARKRTTKPASTARVWTSLWPFAALVAAAVLIYAQTWTYGLLTWDDEHHIVRNPYLWPLSWAGLGVLWRQNYFGEYVPMYYTVIAAETWLAQQWGSTAAPAWGVLHVGATLLHAANGGLVFLILRRLLDTKIPALVGAMLFVVHPLQVESVAWISETRGLLATLFGLLSIWLYIGWFDRRTAAPGAQIPPRSSLGPEKWLWWRYGAALGAFALALLSKPSAVVVPPIMLAMDLWLLRRAWRAALLASAPWFLLALLLGLITKREQSGEQILFAVPIAARPRLAADALGFYLYKLVWPWSLAPDYARPAHWLVEDRWTWATASVPLVALGALFWSRQRTLWIAATIFAVALLPVLNLVQFAYQAYSTVADRYVYLAMLGPALALAWWAGRWPSRTMLAGVAAVLGVLGVLSFLQARHWQNDRTLFAHGLAVSPRSFLAHEKLGVDLLMRDKPEQALEHFQTAQRLYPEMWGPYNNAGVALRKLDRWTEAAEQFAIAVHRMPQAPMLHYNLGDALLKLNKPAEAERSFAEAVRLAPQLIEARFSYAFLLARRGEFAAALRELDEVLRRQPDHPQALFTKGYVLTRLGRFAEAEPCLAAAARLDPANAKSREVLEQVRAKRREAARPESQ
jgi:Flp pilus assembly protein TadD